MTLTTVGSTNTPLEGFTAPASPTASSATSLVRDIDQERHKRLVRIIALGLIILTLGLLPVTLLPKPDPNTMITLGIGLAIDTLAYLLNARNHVTAASVALIAGLVASLGWAIVERGFTHGGLGIADLRTYDFLTLPILLSSVLIGRRGVLIFGAVMAAATTAALLITPRDPGLQAYWLGHSPTSSGSFYDVLALPLALELITVIVAWLAADSVHRSLAKAVRADELASANIQLQLLSNAANESARMKSEFLANMSHEIRTPMNGVIGMTELALQGSLDPESADYIRTAHDSALALLTILNDILDFSKIDAGKLEMESIPFDPREVVESVAELLAPKAADKRLALMTEVAGDIPTGVYGDPSRLRQILLNLVGNAIKFTAQGHVVIRLVSAASTAPGAAKGTSRPEDRDTAAVELRFEITDTGIGIPESKQGRLFEAFTQADGSTTRRFGGTGLGLSISKRLVELMGGAITVESVEGRGSTFAFTLRCTVAEAPAGAQLAWLARAAELRGRRALVVDDNAVQREILSRYLTGWGLHVEVAADGPAALERLRHEAARRTPFDVALVDLMLPGIDGFAIAQAIRLDPRIANTKLILQTAYDEMGLGRQALRIGFAAYLTKPIKRETLLTTLVQVLDTATAQAARVDTPSADDAGATRDKRGVALAAGSPQGAPIAPSALGGEGTAPSRFAYRILLAEDNSVNRKLALLQLRQLGCEIDAAADGREAVVKMRETHYDLILMDCHMPEMDGFEATAAIRASEQFTGGRLPIVAMTADALQGDRERCLAAGMDDYVSKPVTLDSLRAALGRWLPPTADGATVRPTAPAVMTSADGPAIEGTRGCEQREGSGADQTVVGSPSTVGHTVAYAFDEDASPLANVKPGERLLLVVDDNRVNQHLLTLQLTRLGCTVDIAANGREALLKLGQQDYSLILMDCNMPVMDGYEATERIRALEAHGGAGRHVPIIAVTANALHGDREKCLEVGMDEYVPKPVSLPQLRAALSPWIATTETEEETYAPSGHVAGDRASEQAQLSALAPIDEDQLDAIRALQIPGEPDVLQMVLDEYEHDANDLVGQLHQAIAVADVTALHRAAHSLKSSSAYVGARVLSSVCADLEHLCIQTNQSAERGIPEGAQPLVAQIELALRQVIACLKNPAPMEV